MQHQTDTGEMHKLGQCTGREGGATDEIQKDHREGVALELKRQGEKLKKEQSLEWKIWFVLGPVQREAENVELSQDEQLRPCSKEARNS